MSKFLLVVVLLFGLVAPALAAGDSSIELKAYPAPGGVWLVAQSANISCFTITVDVSGENLRCSRKLPVTLDSDGKRSIPVVYLTGADPSRAWRYQSKCRARAGGRRKGAAQPYIYSLPYANAVFPVSQGNLGTFSHYRGSQNEYAIDWAMPTGTVVRAARAGVVVAVRSDSDRGGAALSFANDANYVIVKHSDGTFGEYFHLELHGVLVALGQRVAVGQPLALSGSTGHSTEPHLHFDVFNNIDGDKHATIPIKFKTRSGEIVVPQQGHEY
ncbi:hypothetical protein CCAX7_57790 [Capsulimonas corticalis]|uniref:M23ase beta-sheet core domain-containing protein n=1 Tax=Capsulimonas corticalis TaxID=2219043 RepID=A0A402D041_9BACT|nr:M23 family metallopeptidase [Capsulimonas corticalis]BDI33728.1 hypothetical protein CCAX7_57790 [Capsulimonas corticalis]